MTDDLGWLQGTLPVGTNLVGRYAFDPPGDKTVAVNFPGYAQYVFPSSTPRFSVTFGGHTIEHDPNSVVARPFETRVGNNLTEFNPMGISTGGDGYQVTGIAGFPSFFRDFTGDPVADPNAFFFPYVLWFLKLSDASGTALTASDLPLLPPDISDFAERFGRIGILDANGGPAYAVVDYSVDSIRLVPEPSTFLLAALAGVGLLAVRARLMPTIPTTARSQTPGRRSGGTLVITVAFVDRPRH